MTTPKILRTSPHSEILTAIRACVRMACLLAATTSVGLAAIPAASVSAQDDGGGIFRQDDERFVLLDDYLHFVLIDRSDIANAKGKELLGLGINPREFLDVVDEVQRQRRGRDFLDVTARALRRPELESTAGQILNLYERGRLELARDPDEIARNIELLLGTLRQRNYGRERLMAAGEYAIPQLLEALLQNTDPRRRVRAQEIIIAMERQAVAPLAEAVVGLEAVDQERVAAILGEIPYSASVPALLEVAENGSSPEARAAAAEAARKLNPDAEIAGRAFVEVARRYYQEAEELTSFPGESHQLLWAFDPSIGLIPTPIRTPVFHEAMAMRLVERALDNGYQGTDALALWVASNFSREIDQPAGYDNPAYPSDLREADYFAVASGGDAAEMVLDLALSTNDTPLALRVLAAIDRTAGKGQITTGSSVIEALSYPDRRVRYEAALVIAGVGPDTSFEGSDRVVPLLASSIRFAGDRFAVVLSPGEESYQAAKTALESDGYTVLPRGASIEEISEPLAETPGVDLIVAIGSSNEQRLLLQEVRDDPRLTATPYLGLVESSAVFELRNLFDDDATVTFRDEGVTASALANAASDLVAAASGGQLSDSELATYTFRALSVLRDLAISGDSVLDAERAVLPLIASLDDATGPQRVQIAEVLSLMDRSDAQRALVAAAMKSSGADRVMLLDAAASSGRRFGNLLEDRQADALVDLALTGGSEEAKAAAAVIGSLNLPGAELTKLVTGQSADG